MIRHAAGVVAALLLVPAWAGAQVQTFTVTEAVAPVHKSPSTGSPVIGTARRGAVLEVTRELGDWVKIAWTAAPDAVGYVHLSAGSVGRGGLPAPNTSNTSNTGEAPRPAPRSASSGLRTASRPTAPAILVAEPDDRPTHAHADESASMYVTPPTHVLGLGGHVMGSTLGFGATGRAWSRRQFGLQVDVSRFALTSAVSPARVTTLEIAPSLMYSLPDRVADYFWLRPYVGAGANLTRSSQTGFESTNRTGFQAFGGAEITLASMPRFAISADAGYRWKRTPYEGYELGGLGFTLSGHWYLR